MVRSRRADDAPQLGPGSLLNRYQLIRPVAKGGMGTIWLARLAEEHEFEKLLAIKTILPAYAQIERFRKMLLDEAHLTAKIHHRNVVQVLDVGDGEFGPFIVMEWIDGIALERACTLAESKGTRLPLAVALRIVASACEALHAAHELRSAEGEALGVVHRDASPQNLLISEHGATKVIDFGIARGTTEMALETPGTVRGTPSYMAPEQGLGWRVDRRADVWSLGAILYRVLAGRPPFGRISRLMEFAWGRLATPYPPSALPEGVRCVITRSLARDPNERYPTALEMQRAIEQAMVDAALFATPGDVGDYMRAHAPSLRQSGIHSVEETEQSGPGDTFPSTAPMDPTLPATRKAG